MVLGAGNDHHEHMVQEPTYQYYNVEEEIIGASKKIKKTKSAGPGNIIKKMLLAAA